MKEKMLVISIENDVAILKKLDGEDDCKACPMARICKRNEDEKTIKAFYDNVKIKPGDVVIVKTPKAFVTKLSFFIYTIPLIIFIFTIILFKKFSFSDGLSFTFSLISLAVYYLILKLLDRKLSKKFAPKIIKIIE